MQVLGASAGLRPNMYLQPTRHGVPPLAAGNGLRPLRAGRF